MGPRNQLQCSVPGPHLVSAVLKSQMALSVLEMTERVERITMHMVTVKRRGLIQPRLMGKASTVRGKWGFDFYTGG